MLMIPAATFGASLYIGLTSLDSSGIIGVCFIKILLYP